MNQELVTFWANSEFLNAACKDAQKKVNAYLRECTKQYAPVHVMHMHVNHIHANDEFLVVITLLVDKLTPIG